MTDTNQNPVALAEALLEQAEALLRTAPDDDADAAVHRVRQRAAATRDAVREREAASPASPPHTPGSLRVDTEAPLIFLSVQEIANRYPVGETRLYRAVRAGEIPVIKYGRKILMRKEKVEEWLLGQERAQRGASDRDESKNRRPPTSGA